MDLRGRRVQISGSAGVDTAGHLLADAQVFVATLARQLIEEGAGIVVGAGGEPIGDAGIPCTFDWGVLQIISETSAQAPEWPSHKPGRFRVVASQSALSRIPQDRR